MNNLWTRIGIGAIAVFAVGMVAVSVVQDARESVTSAIKSALEPDTPAAAETPAPPSMDEAANRPVAQLAGLTSLASEVRGAHGAVIQKEMVFRLDGHRIGTIRRLVIQRTTRNELPAMNLTVDLSSSAEAGRLAGCDLLVADGDGNGVEDGFTCSNENAQGMVNVGWVRFEPTGDTRPIAVSEKASRQMQDGDPFKATVESDGEVHVNVSGKDGAGLRINAGDGGANIKVNDALGRALLRLLADSTGAHLRLRDKNGKEIVRMEASNAGFSLVIDSSAGH
jgi:hypothetical protein